MIMKKKPRWRIFQPTWAKGMWVAWHPLHGARYFDTHADAWVFVRERMRISAQIIKARQEAEGKK